MTDVDVAAMTTAVGRQGSPQSGTYGEKADLAELQAELPSVDGPTAPQQPSPMPPMGGFTQPAPGGLPGGLTAPTQRPQEPVSTPLSMPMPISDVPSEQQIATLQAWATNPQASQVFREWAQLALEQYQR
jgi:hypothetical protein